MVIEITDRLSVSNYLHNIVNIPLDTFMYLKQIFSLLYLISFSTHRILQRKGESDNFKLLAFAEGLFYLKKKDF
jgi:hypothetical protein